MSFQLQDKILTYLEGGGGVALHYFLRNLLFRLFIPFIYVFTLTRWWHLRSASF